MKLLRYIGIAFLKWVMMYFVLMLAIQYIVPESLGGWWLALPMWILASAVAFPFAYWALHPSAPTKKGIIELAVVWVVVSALLQIGYDWMIWGQFIFSFNSPELLIQYALEIGMIVIAALYIRKKKLKASMPKGMEA